MYTSQSILAQHLEVCKHDRQMDNQAVYIDSISW